MSPRIPSIEIEARYFSFLKRERGGTVASVVRKMNIISASLVFARTRHFMYSLMHLYMYIRRWNEISKYIRIFLQSLRSKLKFGDRVSLRCSWPDSRELHPQKVVPKFSGDANCAGTLNRFSTNKIFTSIFYWRTDFCHSISFVVFLDICTDIFRALWNVLGRCCYWIRSGCNYVTVLL